MKNKNKNGESLSALQLDFTRLPSFFTRQKTVQMVLDAWIDAGCPYPFKIIRVGNEKVVE